MVRFVVRAGGFQAPKGRVYKAGGNAPGKANFQIPEPLKGRVKCLIVDLNMPFQGVAS